MSNRDRILYTDSMSKSIWDKAFFMDKIEGADTVIDFGCADGSMIRMLSTLFPKIDFIGYDSDPEMITLARDKNRATNTEFFGKDEIDQITRTFSGNDGAHICLNFSSVLHEVFSFTEQGGIDDIRFLVSALKPKFITVRDMFYNNEEHHIMTDLYRRIFSWIEDNPYAKNFREVYMDEDSDWNWRSLTHFLMKYQWVNNGWEEEMKEDYYSWDLHDLRKAVGSGYSMIYENHYQLPHLLERWNREYGIFLPKIHTHAQFILRKED